MVDELSVATIVPEKEPNHDDITQSRECEFGGDMVDEDMVSGDSVDEERFGGDSIGGDSIGGDSIGGDSVDVSTETVGSRMSVSGLLI